MSRKRKMLLLGCHRNKSKLKGLCDYLNITEEEFQDFLDFGKEGIRFLFVMTTALLTCLLLVLTMGG